MRVLLLGSYAPSLLNFRGPLISALKMAGHEVHVSAPGINVELSQRLSKLGAFVHDVPMDRQGTGILNDIRYLIRLVRLYRQIKPELAITYTIKPNVWGAFAGGLTRTKTVALVTGLGLAFTETGRTNSVKVSLLRMIARLLYREATKQNWKVVFQNQDDLKDFKFAGCLQDPSKALMMNGSGVDLQHFSPAPLPNESNFLMISRLLGAKGVREYAQASLAVKRAYPQARFRLVGFYDEGPDAISPDEVSEWIAGGLEYLGSSEDVREHLAKCQVYVLPSYREGTPRSVLEAMATGRAILTTDAPGCRETVVNGENGFLIGLHDTEALKLRMIQMIKEPDLAARMGAFSRRIVEEKYDVLQVNSKLLKDLRLR